MNLIQRKLNCAKRDLWNPHALNSLKIKCEAKKRLSQPK